MGKILRLSSMIAKLSALCAGVNPKLFPQKAAPKRNAIRIAWQSDRSIRALGANRLRVSAEAEEPSPKLSVTAAQVLPTAI